MKKRICILAALLAALLLGSALAATVVVDDSYSDAPANPTQDNVLRLDAVLTPAGEEPLPYAILTMEPTALTINTLDELFVFVDVTKRPPVRFFPEETQAEIRRLLPGIDPDVLYVPEMFSMLPQSLPQTALSPAGQSDADAVADMLMDIEYVPGRPVVVLLGWQTAEGVEWKALKASVLVKDTIHYEIPRETLDAIAGRETILVLLTLKPGMGWEQTETVLTPVETNIPSKSGSTIIYIEDAIVISGTGDASDCAIILTAETDPIAAEMTRYADYLATEGAAPTAYFDALITDEMAKALKEADLASLLPYETAYVQVVNYQEPFGDVMARFLFPTPFAEDREMSALLGMPDEEGVLHWTVLRCEMIDGFIEITFSSTVLPAMMEDTGLLLVFSEPLTD